MNHLQGRHTVPVDRLLWVCPGTVLKNTVLSKKSISITMAAGGTNDLSASLIDSPQDAAIFNRISVQRAALEDPIVAALKGRPSFGAAEAHFTVVSGDAELPVKRVSSRLVDSGASSVHAGLPVKRVSSRSIASSISSDHVGAFDSTGFRNPRQRRLTEIEVAMKEELVGANGKPDRVSVHKHKLGEWYSTAICGNDILSSCLYVAGVLRAVGNISLSFLVYFPYF
jgi:hypothetical protein